MANFGVEATAISPIQNNINPTQGVETPSIAGAVNTLVEGVAGVFEQRREDKNASFISDFVANQVRVTDALEQGTGGVRTAAQARTLMRRNFLEARAANPALTADLIDAQKSILGLFGNSSLLSEGTIEEQRINDRRDQLVSSGQVSATATDIEFEQADQAARIAVAAQERFDERMNTVNAELALLNLDSRRRTELETLKSEETRRFINDTSVVELNSLRSQFDTIIGSDTTEADKIQAIESIFVNWRTEANALIGNVETGEFNAFMTPFEQLKDLSLRIASGEIEDSAVTRETDRILALNKNIALADPVIANIATASTLFSDTIFQQALIGNDEAFQAALNYMAGTSSDNPGSSTPPPFTTDGNESKAISEVLGTVLRGLDSPDEGVSSEATARVTTFLESIEDYEGLIRRDPEAGIDLVSWMATPQFQQAVTAHPEVFANLDGAAQVIDSHYNNEVWGMVANEFRNNKIGVIQGTGEVQVGSSTGGAVTRSVPTLGSVGTPAAIGARSTPTGMEFYILEGYEGEDQRGVQQQLRDLNNDLKPVINTTLRAAAHLEGNTNYQAMWDKVGSQLLEGGMMNDEGDDLSLDSYYEGGNTGPIVGSVVDAGAGYTVIKNDNGETVRREGTRAWRNNNPGNIEAGNFANSHGAVGSDGRFAVFPTYEAGRAAKGALLFESSSYRDRTIASALNRYAPPSENNTNRYTSTVAGAIGVPSDTKLSDLSAEQRETMLDAMERVEGFREGTETIVGSSTAEFATEAEAVAAFDAGEISIGDTITVNGVEMEVGE